MKQFETAAFRMTIHDNLLKEVKVKKNVTYSEKDVWESRDLSLEYKPNARFYVLFEGEENSSVTAAAKSAVATDEYNMYVAALALCGNSMLEAIAGNLFLTINRPKVPTKYFDNRGQAIEWLTLQMGRKK